MLLLVFSLQRSFEPFRLSLLPWRQEATPEYLDRNLKLEKIHPFLSEQIDESLFVFFQHLRYLARG